MTYLLPFLSFLFDNPMKTSKKSVADWGRFIIASLNTFPSSTNDKTKSLYLV